MPYKTERGTHYHMTYGCCRATIPCGTAGLEPCSICCGKGGGTDGGNAGAPGSISVDSDIIGVTSFRFKGVDGTLYKLDKKLSPEDRQEISGLEGVQTVVVVPEYAPEIQRTGIFIEDGYSYTVSRAGEVAAAGIVAMTDPVSAPDPGLAPVAQALAGAGDEPSERAKELGVADLQVDDVDVDGVVRGISREYSRIYDADVRDERVEGYEEALALGDEIIRLRPDIVGAVAKARGDFISSDREVAALGFAFPGAIKPATVEIPPLHLVDPSATRMLVASAWKEAAEAREADADVRAYTQAERRRDGIAALLERGLASDIDVSMPGPVTRGFRELLAACDVTDAPGGGIDGYTKALVQNYVVFAACRDAGVGGSEADYCASHALDAVRGYSLRLRDGLDGDLALDAIRQGIDSSALYPQREYGELGSAGVPIHRRESLDAAVARQAEEGRALSRMAAADRRGMWQEEADGWARLWAGSRQIVGEGRDGLDVVVSYHDFPTAKGSADLDAAQARNRAADRLRLRYGRAYTPAMGRERERAWDVAKSKALRELSSRQQAGMQRSRLVGDALADVRSTRTYDESTPVASLHPEARRELARTLAERLVREGSPSTARRDAERLESVMSGGSIADLRDLAHGDPMAAVDLACAGAEVSMRARGQWDGFGGWSA